MKVHDTYLKVILSFIAACLLWICARDLSFSSSALASGFEAGDVIDVRIVGVDKSSDWDPLDVQLRGINEAAHLRWEAIKVEIDR